MEVPVPFLKHATGAGDVAKAALSKLGIEQKPGDCGCKKRQAAMNQKLKFVPKPRVVAPAQPSVKASIWGALPEAAEGWEMVERCEACALYRKTGAEEYVLWRITEGRYHGAQPMRGDAAAAHAELEAICPGR